jgi:hypothetical protein
MVVGHLHDEDPHAIRVADPHLPQAPGLVRRRLEDLDSILGELGVDVVDIAWARLPRFPE